jgi:hypothetical protein
VAGGQVDRSESRATGRASWIVCPRICSVRKVFAHPHLLRFHPPIPPPQVECWLAPFQTPRMERCWLALFQTPQMERCWLALFQKPRMERCWLALFQKPRMERAINGWCGRSIIVVGHTWVLRAISGCYGPHMGVVGCAWVLGWCGPSMGVMGVMGHIWVLMALHGWYASSMGGCAKHGCCGLSMGGVGKVLAWEREKNSASRTPNPNCCPHTIFSHLPPIFLMSAPFRHSEGASLVPFGLCMHMGRLNHLRSAFSSHDRAAKLPALFPPVQPNHAVSKFPTR